MWKSRNLFASTSFVTDPGTGPVILLPLNTNDIMFLRSPRFVGNVPISNNSDQ